MAVEEGVQGDPSPWSPLKAKNCIPKQGGNLLLNVYFGPMSEAIYDTSAYFNNVYFDIWLEEKFTQDILRAIDKGVVLSNHAVETKALGIIPVTSLSSGAKTLLLIDHMPDKVFYTSNCGDNCAPWILKIARRHKEDITINLHHRFRQR